MTTLVTIVEGDGEVAALPILLTKLIDWNQHNVSLSRPKNAHGRTNLTRPDGLEKFLERERREAECDGVLVLIDADTDCATELARDLAARAQNLGLPFPVAIVCAKCEYEAWFLASLETIAGQYVIMPSGSAYKETQHQARMTELLDPNLVRPRSRSFRRLEHALEELLSGALVVTPQCKIP